MFEMFKLIVSDLGVWDVRGNLYHKIHYKEKLILKFKIIFVVIIFFLIIIIIMNILFQILLNISTYWILSMIIQIYNYCEIC